MKRALLVGINAYPQKALRLRGCVADVERMSAVLPRYGFDAASVHLLRDEAATRAEIERELHWLCDGAREGDVCLFHYSGHGASVADRNGDDEGGRDECLVPVDHETAGKLVDDDLATFYAGMARGCNFTLLMDCCHSGTNQKAHLRDVTYRFVPTSHEEELAIAAARRRYRAEREAFVAQAAAEQDALGLDELRRLVQALLGRFDAGRGQLGNVRSRETNLLLAACDARQKAAEAVLGGAHQGAFSHFLRMAMDSLGPEATALAVTTRVSQLLRAEGLAQIPQLEGRDEHKLRPLFAPFT